ncbi:hypothetical protein HYH03_018888 [Edaphochlamys debaryana]|uniref:Uncharacterized protein n=1 Tax=Edaphochlamys debaryana TaxID=47281 RepID=A0A836BMV6_9CHLO|nr:hypothetical protein HYH03_018893 [Edaphochlamys debaryana]KAG2482164.1 hypothetical protein HYH03_018888 [Edaphochlamys debaryana]|eukprot:KAG2482157.1 hypothetical protein HYH03_018893 [Edaphochlamys debaryana]
MNRSMCSGRVAAGPRALPTRARSAHRAAAQRTTVRVCLSLRSVGVIAELFGVLPPEGAPVLQKLVKAVKEDMEEAQQERQEAQQERQEAQQERQQAQQERQQAEQRKDEAVAVMIREKDEKMVLADKFRQQEKMLARAMYSAGVRDGRSCLEFLETLNGIVRRQRVKGWTKVLEQRPDLIDCLAKAAPSWGVDVNDSKAAEKLAGKIAGMFNVLSNRIHTFVPEVGLVVYAGVPDSPTGEALVCLAEAFGVPCERHQSVSL